MSSAIVEKLRKAIKGLLYPSESDEPFEIVHWPGVNEAPTKEKLLELLGEAPCTVNEHSVEETFKELTSQDEGKDEEERADAEKFRHLHSVVQENLVDAKVFRFGGPQVQVYLVGRTKGGDWAGLKTVSVET